MHLGSGVSSVFGHLIAEKYAGVMHIMRNSWSFIQELSGFKVPSAC